MWISRWQDVCGHTYIHEMQLRSAGAEDWLWEFIAVGICRDGLAHSAEVFAIDQLGQARRRFDELAAGAATNGEPT